MCLSALLNPILNLFCPILNWQNSTINKCDTIRAVRCGVELPARTIIIRKCGNKEEKMTTNKLAQSIFNKLAAICVLLALVVGFVGTSGLVTNAAIVGDGTYYADFNTLEEAQDAAAKLHEEIVGEGAVLLKNANNALPMGGSEYVSVFGANASKLGGYSLHKALTDEGFTVNGKLQNYYANNGAETGAFNNSVKDSFRLYNDAAIVVISRGSGESARGSGGSVATAELADDANENNGWTHAALAQNDDEKEVKHSLMLTNAELAMIATVKEAGFGKIVVLVSCAMPMEIKNLADDNAIDTIMWVGSLGENGAKAVAKILSGKVNPSGKTSDTWYTDFTADPTWYNLGNNSQAGGAGATYMLADGTQFASGLDYEEGIYRGYRFYETRAYEMNQANAESGDAWYNTAMTYPFGYGLSYTTFAYSNVSVKLSDGTALNDSATGLADKFVSYKGHEAAVKYATAYVTIKNTGNVAGKEAVQVYATAPYTGKVEKSYVTLVGFAKTKTLRPGESQTLAINFNIQDMASYDAEGAASTDGKTGYVLEQGAYAIHVMANSHGWANATAADYGKVDFELDKTTYLQLDDYSGNELSNVYSKENGLNYTLRRNDGDIKINATDDTGMTLLSRKDLGATTIAEIASFPKAPTTKDLTVTKDFANQFAYWNTFSIGKTLPNGMTDTEGRNYYVDGQTILGEDGTTKIIDGATAFPWMAEATANADRMAKWDQAVTELTGKNAAAILLSELAGVDPYGTTPIVHSNELLNGKTGADAWDLFLNQLTWQQLKELVMKLQKGSIEAIDFRAYKGADSSLNYNSTYAWSCNSLLAATWNKDLSEKQGAIIGNFALLKGLNVWWGPGTQTHRSFFDNRGNEYFSDDPYLSGMMSLGETEGCQSKGVVCCIKHCAMYDDNASGYGGSPMSAEGNRGGVMMASEQAMREIILRPFQINVQEGNAGSVMGSFNRFGRMTSCTSYNTTVELFRNQWGCDELTWTTDIFFAFGKMCTADLMVRTGSDNVDGGGIEITGTWDTEKKTVVLPIGENGANVEAPYVYYVTRMAALRICNLHAQSAMSQNASDFSAWQTKEIEASQGVALAKGVTIAGDIADASYELVGGNLPEGITLASDGTLSGTALVAGDFSFTVKCSSAGWLNSTQTFTLKVASAFEVTGTDATVGEEFDEVISSEKISTDAGLTEVKYTVKSGNLPAGITLAEDGTLSGTPTVAGKYLVVVNVAAVKEEAGRWGTTRTVTNYEVTIVINVASDGSEPVVDHGGIVSVVKTSSEGLVDTYTITYADGTTETFTVTNGKDGVNGKDGIDGKDGANGKDGLNGKDGANGADGKGCNGVVGVSSIALAVVALGGTVLAIRKKKQD